MAEPWHEPSAVSSRFTPLITGILAVVSLGEGRPRGSAARVSFWRRPIRRICDSATRGKESAILSIDKEIKTVA
jgi:hypothetical protein